ncbi:MAG: 4Fe-4S binding protein [Epsilonproteobacteria bacterium]|nr:4Fe-4S binding protein [Campylobacterota bacterium]
MSIINIELGNCVKVFSKNASCTNCADICPEKVITYTDNVPQVDSSCTECGLCLGTCPTEAISLKSFDTLEFIFSFLEKEEHTIACKNEIPCLGILSVEHLVSLSILSVHETLTLQSCELCHQQLTTYVSEANYLLDALQCGKSITLEQKLEETKRESVEEQSEDRRAFLQRLSLKGAIKSKVEFEQEVQSHETRTLSQEDSANIRKKELPNKRKLLYMALKRLHKIDEFKLIEESYLSFISQKRIEQSCDNCSICYRVCPTGALNSDKRGSKIHFDALSCVKCRLCHDVCEPDAIKLEAFNTKSFFKPKIDELIKFNVMRCNECANFFTYQGGEVICPRCKLEEEEAKELWGIQ